MERIEKTRVFLTGLVLGSAAGAVVSMLMAPASGDETRRKVKQNIDEARRQAELAVEDARGYLENAQDTARSRAEELSDEARQRTARLKEIGNKVIQEQKASLDRGKKEAQEVLKP